jgi:hypothetical protein
MIRINNKVESMWPHVGDVGQEVSDKAIHFSLIKIIKN